MSECVTLHIWGCSGLSLRKAVERVHKFLGAEAVGLLYGARQCLFCTYADGEFVGAGDRVVPTKQSYEARFFSPHGELRWLAELSPGENQIEGGRAVFLSTYHGESSVIEGWNKLDSIAGLEVMENRYLLWGEGYSGRGAVSNENWGTLAAGNIGKIHIPLRGLKDFGRVQLKTSEFMGLEPGPAGEHGNVVVIEEIWQELSPIPSQE